MHHRLGKPLPCQLTNAPQVHLMPEPCSSFKRIKMPQSFLWGVSFRFQKLSPCFSQVPYVLLTRSPLYSEEYRSTCMY